MRKSVIHAGTITAGFFASIFVLFLYSCGGGGSKNPADNGNNGTNGDTTSWSAADQKVLQDARADYLTLAKAKTPAAARTELAGMLKKTAEVADAVVFEDGYTVFVKFADGTYGAVNTLDYDALNAGVSSIKYKAPKASVAPLRPKAARTATESIPGSEKVLFLNISQYRFPGNAAAIAHIMSTLQGIGLESGNFVTKTRGSQTDQSVTPQDIMSLDKYGFAVIFAQGMYGTYGGETHAYLEMCAAGSYSGSAGSTVTESLQNGRVILCDGSLYIRDDLLSQMLPAMPKSMIYLMGNYGAQSVPAFTGKQCWGCFGWDGVVMSADGYNALADIFESMAKGIPPHSTGDAYSAPGLVRESTGPENTVAKLVMKPANSEVFLPAWMFATVIPSSTPEGAARYDLVVQEYSKTLPTVKFTSSTCRVDSLIPGRAVISIKAYDSAGKYIAVASVSDTLFPGSNNFNFDFKRQIVPFRAKRVDTMTDNQYAPYRAFFYGYYNFKITPGVRQYKMITHSGNDKYEQTIYYTIGDNLYLRSDACFDRAGITSIFGSNFFDTGEDEFTTAFEGFIEYGDSEKADTEKKWAKYKGQEATVYAEIFPY